jgi:ectoine hydroxylase-related dioxygenase (phytanoyl-CoA dioxygenase family)
MAKLLTVNVPTSSSPKLVDPIYELKTKGYTVLPEVFTGKLLSKLIRKNESYWKGFKSSKLYQRNYGSIRRRSKFRGSTVMFLTSGRYDLALDHGIFQSRKFLENKKVLTIVNSLFKTGYTSYAGSVPSQPGSLDGYWHRDVWSLFNDSKLEGTLPIFYITVLIPLVDLTKENGPVEIKIGSQRETEGRETVTTSGAKAGDAIILHGNVLHRGLSNNSRKIRHMIYVVYCSRWYYEYEEYEKV